MADEPKKVDDPKKATDSKKLLAKIEALEAAQKKGTTELAAALERAKKAEDKITSAKADDAVKKGEFEKLFNESTLKIKELETSQAGAEKVQDAIVQILETEKKGILKERAALVPEALSPMEQLQYIHANRGVLFEKSKVGSFNADKNKSDEPGVGMKTALANLSAKTDIPMEERVDAVFDAVGESIEG